ncbi:MAG: tyrosine-type recombinase/integrase, partial [Candidatus Latescibacterota bacterium]|nr:tyrosine-type recombinase/integrase [Candidatus Latescibacterota bacterium]
RSGLGSDVCAYTLRHTSATWLAAAGVPLRDIAGMMGHSTVRVTELYAKFSPDFLRNAAETMDGLIATG